LQMGGIVEEQLQRAISALVDGDPELGRQVVRDDYRVNALEVEIDEECTRIVALRQPAASDLRLVMAVIKTITDLERIGDEAKRVAKMVVHEADGSMRSEVRQEIEHMGGMIRRQLRMVLDAFARTDVETAVEVVKADAKVDDKYHSITRHLITYMAEDSKNIPGILNIMWAARAMERMGDRCENIAEYVFYLVHGRDIRHTSLDEAIEEIGG
ncbi:MAG: phosphate signaling complex protein PhoU, partial [Xanthomonadales bacterium]|nr:phosphate signaling complex protein PhoU [Xanthomonadales bacterium]